MQEEIGCGGNRATKGTIKASMSMGSLRSYDMAYGRHLFSILMINYSETSFRYLAVHNKLYWSEVRN